MTINLTGFEVKQIGFPICFCLPRAETGPCCDCTGTEAGSGPGQLATPGGAGSGYPPITAKGVLMLLYTSS